MKGGKEARCRRMRERERESSKIDQNQNVCIRTELIIIRVNI